jgi:hypothetical protein
MKAPEQTNIPIQPVDEPSCATPSMNPPPLVYDTETALLTHAGETPGQLLVHRRNEQDQHRKICLHGEEERDDLPRSTS